MGALNSQGYFETSNPAWRTVLGWSEEEVASMSIFELLHPDDVERTRAGFELTQLGQPAIRFPNRYRCKDGGYRWISWVGVPEDGMVYCSGRDITEEKAAEAELAAAQEALRQSQKMEAVGQLTGGIAHDFNNLLAGISGSLELLEKRLAEGRMAGAERYISAAQGAAKRAASLTQRLLAFSRRQTLDPKTLDVNKLIGGMEELIRRSVGPTITVEVVGAGGLWMTRADPSQLENSLLNLCINARDAMAPDGGRLTIETANKWLDHRAAQQRDVPPGQYVSLCVTDTGTGMETEVIARAFDPFFTTKPLGQGTGLGLSMIYGFVRQSGGQIRIYSEVGKGTTMCLYLPRYLGPLDNAEDAAPYAMTDRGDGETILVVDDERTIRMLIADVLEENGFAALEAEDGASGLRIIQSDVRIDLLITDVGLPGGMNGRQLADAALALRPGLKVLFITGYAENAVVGNGHLQAGMEVITKPFVVAELGRKVRDLIER
jgi:PAS domain S-box-containing protein